MMIRGIVQSVVEGVIKRFTATGRADETITDRELFQQYGYTSRPLAGAELIVIREGNAFIAVASDDRRYRIAVENGEVALYTDEEDAIHLKRGRVIEITGGEQVIVNTKIATVTATTNTTVTSPLVTVVASDKIVLDTPLAEITGDLAVAGGITSSGTFGASGGRIETPGNIKSTAGEIGDAVRNLSADRTIYNSHTHPENGTGGGTTSAPNEAM